MEDFESAGGILKISLRHLGAQNLPEEFKGLFSRVPKKRTFGILLMPLGLPPGAQLSSEETPVVSANP